LLEMGNLDLARKEIEKARKLNPYDEEILDIEKELGSGVVK